MSCQKLASNLYAESGFARIDVPEVAMSYARFASAASLVEEFMDAQPQFQRVEDLEDCRPGDLVGFRIRRVVHHVGVVLACGFFVHACEHLGVVYSSLSDPTWSTRLAAIWRPRIKGEQQ